MYDSIIIGGGPAGLTAAIYLARKKMNILLLSSEFGGQTAKAAGIENYPGFIKISGAELIAKTLEQIQALEVENKNEEVKSVEKNENGFKVLTKDQTYQTRSVVICSGKTHRKLNVPGEDEFVGKGVSYCATCDAPLFKDKTVVVIGGGNSAMDAATEIEKYAQKVFVLAVTSELQCDAVLKERFEKSEKGKIIYNAQTTEVYGDGFIKGLKYKDQGSGEIVDLACDGIFVEIGWTPSTDFVKDLLKISELKEIEVDQNGATSVSGIFSAGDVTNTPFKQIVIASGDGAKAALSAWKYLIMQKSR